MPWVLYLIVMSLAPRGDRSAAAQRDGLAAVLDRWGASTPFFVGIADPTYHLTFYDAWQPSRTLHTVEALGHPSACLDDLPDCTLWMLRTPSRQGRTTALLVPAGTTLILTHILSAIGLAHTHQAYTAANWLSSGLGELAVSPAHLTRDRALQSVRTGRSYLAHPSTTLHQPLLTLTEM